MQTAQQTNAIAKSFTACDCRVAEGLTKTRVAPKVDGAMITCHHRIGEVQVLRADRLETSYRGVLGTEASTAAATFSRIQSARQGASDDRVLRRVE